VPPHRIRLREPWERESTADGGVRLRRFFNAPPLATNERISIVCDGLQAEAAASLNGATLGVWSPSPGVATAEIASPLPPRNEIVLTFPSPPTGDGSLPWREVRLEIAGP
jgi:hypothetical protein